MAATRQEYHIECSANRSEFMTSPSIQHDDWAKGLPLDAPVGSWAAATLRHCLQGVEHYLALALSEPKQDIEHVHQLRVWTRRATAALRVYGKLLPRRRSSWMKKQMRRIRRASNPARDCDVLAERLTTQASDPEVSRWLTEVQAEREKAQKALAELTQHLDPDRFKRRIERLIKRAGRRPGQHATHSDTPFQRWARSTLRPIAKAFLRAFPTRGASVPALHRFRICAKTLRYAMELLASAFEPAFRESLLPRVKDLQDQLGSINDLAVAHRRLEKRIKKARRGKKSKRLRQMMKAGAEELDRSRQKFVSSCSPRIRKDLRRELGELMIQGKC